MLSSLGTVTLFWPGRISAEKLPDSLMGFPCMFIVFLPLLIFSFSHLKLQCLGVFLGVNPSGTLLPGLTIYCFPFLVLQFSISISSNMFSAPFSLSSFWDPMMQIISVLIVIPECVELTGSFLCVS